MEEIFLNKRQYNPFGANPMALSNINCLADSLIGRLEKCVEVKISRAMIGSDVTTAGVEPRLKAMSCLADGLRVEEMCESVRCGKPWLKVNKLPKNGRPLGPGILTRPIWALPFRQAGPPGVNAHVRRSMRRERMRRVRIVMV